MLGKWMEYLGIALIITGIASVLVLLFKRTSLGVYLAPCAEVIVAGVGLVYLDKQSNKQA